MLLDILYSVLSYISSTKLNVSLSEYFGPLSRNSYMPSVNVETSRYRGHLKPQTSHQPENDSFLVNLKGQSTIIIYLDLEINPANYL